MKKKSMVLAGLLLSFFSFFLSSESQVRERKFARDGSPQGVQGSNIYWARAYGGDEFDTAYRIVPTNEGGYIVGGMTGSFGAGAQDLWILKFDAEGTIDWQKSYGGNRRDGYYWVSIRQTNDGGYIVLTDTESFGAGGRDIWILKIYQNGDVEWQKTYGSSDNENPGSIRQTSDGGYIVAASMRGSSSPRYDFWVLKLFPNGEIEWQQTYGGGDDDYADAVEQTADGGYIVSGSTGYGSYGCWLLKLSPTGQMEWRKIYGTQERWYNYDVQVQQTNDGGYIVCDFTDRFGSGLYDFLIMKLFSDGTIEWQKTYGGSSEDMQPYAIHQTQDGGYIVGGITVSFRPGGADYWDGWVIKLDSAGRIEWQKYYGSTATEWLFDIVPRKGGGYIFAGCTESEGGGDFWIGKIDPYGNLGPGEHEGISNGQVKDTSISPTIPYAEAKATIVVPQNTSVNPLNTSASSKLLSWNLNQPPENISLTSEINRSLFKKESYCRVRWNQNIYNNQFNIVEYRIYRKEVPDIASGGYKLIKSVPGNVLDFGDGPLDGKKTYYYVITSVDAEGHESTKSKEVHN